MLCFQVGEPTLDTHDDAGGNYIFEWKTKEACEVKASSEPGCDDKHTLISGLKRDKKEVTVFNELPFLYYELDHLQLLHYSTEYIQRAHSTTLPMILSVVNLGD